MGADTQEIIYRTVWISDTHLGTKNCNADGILDFFRNTHSDYLYLVGDIVDGWRLKRNWYWPQAHNDVIQKLLRKARKGTRVVYVPGNHDAFARVFAGNSLGTIEVVEEALHVTADGRRLLVLHGDSFDGIIHYARWLAVLGDHAYTLALTMNNWFNLVRRLFGYDYWSLSRYLKHKVKNAVQFISNYETAVLNAARIRQVDGVVCGHIHHAELRNVGECLYANCGDWVESNSALVEHLDGRLEIIYWPPLASVTTSREIP